MRISEFPMLNEVKEEYIQFRKEGKSRKDATAALVRSYQNELTYGVSDDALFFWIGLADGQYYRKELDEETASKALHALNQLENDYPQITNRDITIRKQHYSMAPMAEKGVRKNPAKRRCMWNVGDTFALLLQSEESRRLGIAGKFVLFRMVEAVNFDGREVPAVMLSLWDNEPFPNESSEYQKRPFLKIRAGGRCSSPEEKSEYRGLLLLKTKKHLEQMQLQYIGNFQNVELPNDEIFFSNPAFMTLLLPEDIECEACICWKWHVLQTEGYWPEPITEK